LDVGALSSVSGGEIQANGGRPYGSYIGGGGGGGRIAIYYEVLEFEQNNIVALGGLRGSTSSTHGAPGTVFIKDKTGAVNHPLYITGSGSSGSYAVTTLESVGSEGVVIDNASVEYTGVDPIAGEVTILSGRMVIPGDVTFDQLFIGNDAASAFITVGGQLTVPNNALVVDGITLSLAQDHTFESIHIKNGGVLTTPVATEIFKNGIAIEATTIIVDEGSRIDVSGKGFLGDSSAGRYTGGSHGGRGGYYESPFPGHVY